MPIHAHKLATLSVWALISLGAVPILHAQNPFQSVLNGLNKMKQQLQQGATQPASQQTAQPTAAQPSPAQSAAPAVPTAGAGQSNSVPPGSLEEMLTTAQAQLPALPAGGLDPSVLPDVLGVHIGTPTTQAVEQLNALYPTVHSGGAPWGTGLSHIQYAPTKDPPYTSSLSGLRPNNDGCGPTDCQASDAIFAVFSGPPDTRMVSIQRTLSYSSQRQVPSDTFRDSLVQKYGPHFAQFPLNVMVWAFDEQGKPLTLSQNDATCAKGEGLISQQGYGPPNPYLMTSYLGISTPVPQLQQQTITRVLRMKCVRGIVVTADISGRPGGMAQQLQVTITEVAVDLRDAFAAEIYLQQSANAQAKQQVQNAQQQSGPKF